MLKILLIKDDLPEDAEKPRRQSFKRIDMVSLLNDLYG